MYRVFLSILLLTSISLQGQTRRPVREHLAISHVNAATGLRATRETDFVMMPVEGGTFTMQYWQCGMPNGRTYNNTVRVSGFYLSRYETTELQWKTVMGDDYRITGCDSCPVVRVTWHEAVVFAQKISQATGHTYRLPTNAEWEYACGGGSMGKGKPYAGSDFLGDVAWYRENSGYLIQRVGQKQPNELGLCDMLGNVDEWCSDWSVMEWPGEYLERVTKDPKGPPTGRRKVCRGGDIYTQSENILNWFPRHQAPDDGNATIGFRLVREMGD